MSGPDAGDRLADLALLALGHGIRSIEQGGPLIPFVLTEIGNERMVHRFLDERPGGISLEGGLAQARSWVEGLDEALDAYAIAYEGSVTIEGGPRDAILVEAVEVSSGARARFAQPYRAKRLFRRARAEGQPVTLEAP
jgi:hypothetical protein